MNTKYHSLSININDYANIDPKNIFDLTDEERREMNNEAIHAFIEYADQFLTIMGLEMLPTGEVIGPVGTYVSQEFEEAFLECLAFWDDREVSERWANIDVSRVTLTVNWVEGTARLERMRDGEMVVIGQVEFEATEEAETTYEALNEAFEAAGLDITWDEDTADDDYGDFSVVRKFGLCPLR